MLKSVPYLAPLLVATFLFPVSAHADTHSPGAVSRALAATRGVPRSKSASMRRANRRNCLPLRNCGRAGVSQISCREMPTSRES
jgi:hypothetical protein